VSIAWRIVDGVKKKRIAALIFSAVYDAAQVLLGFVSLKR